MGIEANIEHEEPAIENTPTKISADTFSIVKRIPTLRELMRTRDELRNSEIPLFLILAICLYTNLRVLHPQQPKEWALAETYRRMPESDPENMAKYKPQYNLSRNLFI